MCVCVGVWVVLGESNSPWPRVEVACLAAKVVCLLGYTVLCCLLLHALPPLLTRSAE